MIYASPTSIKEDSPVAIVNAEAKKNTLNVCVENGKVCLTPGCIHAASSMLQKMDTKINPCDDFYKFRYDAKDFKE